MSSGRGGRVPSIREFAEWLTPQDVARALGVSRQAVHERLERGTLVPKNQSVKTRSGWLVKPEAVGGLTTKGDGDA